MEQLILVTADTISIFSRFIPDLIKEEYLSGENFLFYGITWENTACGIVILKPDGDSVILQYLFLEEEFRGFGVGTRIFTATLLKMYEAGYTAVTISYCPTDSPAIERILKGYPYTVTPLEKGIFSFRLKDINDASALKGSHSHVVALRQMSDMNLKLLGNQLADTGNDLVPLPLRQTDYLADCSAVYMEKDTPAGILLLCRDETGGLSIPLLYSSASDSTAALKMMCFVYERSMAEFPEDTRVQIHVIHGGLLKLLEKITGQTADRQQKVEISLSIFDLPSQQFEAGML